jgi:hypothetical protein
MKPLKKTKKTQRYNPISSCPPPAIYDTARPRQRTVQKGGMVTLSSELKRGIQVSVAQVNATTFIVSGSRDELHKIMEGLPKPATSPFAALAEAFRGRAHERASARLRPSYSGSPDLPSIADDEALANASLQRSRRPR